MLLLPRSPILMSCTSDAPRRGGSDDGDVSRSDGDDAEVEGETTTGRGCVKWERVSERAKKGGDFMQSAPNVFLSVL